LIECQIRAPGICPNPSYCSLKKERKKEKKKLLLGYIIKTCIIEERKGIH